jgi:FkbM family methyltransferase
MLNNYSQLGQDLEVIKFYKSKRNGYFIEIGASDGIELSNTYLLEKEYDWKGICVEPIPNRFVNLVQNRPNSKCCNKAVYNTSGLVLNFEISNSYDLLSGLSNTLDRHKNFVGSNKIDINVETITFNDLLEEYQAPKFIEYLSLDTEGSELEILKSCDFSKYTFGLIDVEHNYVEPRRTEIRNLLTSNGYIYVKHNSYDDCYKHSSLI